MATWEDIGKKLKRGRDSARYAQAEEARTGRIDPATGLVANEHTNTDAPRNKIWVRLGATQANPVGRGEVAVWNLGAGAVRTDIPDMPVLVDFNKQGELKISDSDDQATDSWAGDAGAIASQPPLIPAEVNNTLIRVENLLDFKPAVAATGGLDLYVSPGWYNGNRWEGGSITLVPTASASRKAWVVVGFDEVIGAPVQDLGTDTSLAFPAIPLSDIATTWGSATFANARPIAAVPLANGATSLSNSLIVDIRDAFSAASAGATTFDPDTIMTDADFSVMVDADGSIMVTS